VTQHHLSLTPAQQRQMLTEGSIQIGALVLPSILKAGGRLFAQSRVPVAPLQNASQTVTSRVGQLQGAIPAAQQGRITMAVAVVEDSNGVRSILVSSSEGAYVRGPVRPVVQGWGDATVVGGTGHAEANIIAHAQANNLRVIDIGATRPVCVPCQDVINPTGANISTPLRPRPGN
jgi:filamentous hemagglutinin